MAKSRKQWEGEILSFEFGPFTLVPSRQLLLKDGVSVRIGGRAIEILSVLVCEAGRIVTKKELMASVWPDTVVEEGNLKVNMAVLRRILGDNTDDVSFIGTVIGRGYRFVAPVRTRAANLLAVATTDRLHNLPTSSTRIIGRQDVISALQRDMQESRLVSIVGSGGVGKTTIALAVAEGALGHQPDGVWLVDLSTLKDPDLIANAIATAVGLAAHSANMEAALCDFLREREMLIVLDSCEHFIDAASAIVEHLLCRTKDVRILVTSREPLRIRTERVRRIAGLATPPETAELTADVALSFPAIELFVARVTDSLEAFTLTDLNVGTVSAICRRLDGIALAIELAAPRVMSLGVNGLLENLDGRMQLLECKRGAVVRHRTLSATIDWSYDLLSDRERRTMRRLSVFAGAFSLESALAIAGEGDAPTDLSIDIANLVAKSLLSAEVNGDSIEYRQLDTTRDYAFERLLEGQEVTITRRRHAEHFTAIAERASRDAKLASMASWLERYAMKMNDVRSALHWAFGPDGDAQLGVRSTIAALIFWKQLSLVEECRRAVDRALAPQNAPYRTEIDTLLLHLNQGATTLHTHGPVLQVKSSLEDALASAQRVGAVDLQLEALRGLSEYELWTGDAKAAIVVADRMRALDSADQRVIAADADAQSGSALSWLGALDASRNRLEAIVRRPLSQDLQSTVARFDFDQRLTARGTLASVLWLLGYPEQAMEMARLQLAEAEASNFAVSLCYALTHGSLVVALYVRDYEKARKCLERGMGHADAHGLAIWKAMAACVWTRYQIYTRQPVDFGANREALAAVRESGFRMRYANYLTNYGEALAHHGEVDRGLGCIDEAIALCEANGQVVGLPEMLRIRGNVLRFGKLGRKDEALDCYLRSLALARQAGALAWELRTAISLVAFCRQTGEEVQAEEALSDAYGRFTEGHNTGDLVRARTLLEARQAA